MFNTVILITILLTGVSAIPFEDCGSRYDLRQVDIEGCSRAPCLMTIESTVNVTATFYASFASKALDNDVIFFINNIEMEAAVTQHTCQGSSQEIRACDLSTAQLVQFHAQISVDESVPPFPGQLVWKIFNEQNVPLICFKVSVILSEDKRSNEELL